MTSESNTEEIVDQTDENTETTEDTFDRAYVEDLRAESAKYRTRAKAADDLAHRLHAELVRATGVLADPTDLDFDEAHLDDPESLTAALEELVERKPHLRARTVAGDVGQGQSGGGSVSLIDVLKGRV
ncbi:putative protein OS=Tsukamurella paurometabola (strain ATCC 8368 / DSM / CCUG 35730 /CIP 100753 / JCM 10117 / KCTC 9821 / NBRC 16120 / NCIMB 702349/ NCTC 13040) OX=521096 GN=Tpau_3896 PE=4 SV=1 [Tsukamurella paurometabola]|uniref:Uncharacterized protein n=1 Tax=Tsukamurella paurometabola (strain ATCC 8368 / DSM 20162 / CCUG 35730 / CIP 100753 / JCM 10117 / KCTC 9821 / NBRC 16120 / NCIMB 702349 / NCTC 13040) TaxID=521096 RepID=D5UMJ4_TSUPD|nr:hypothetical protein [Tsukamurella paurometabola]ADG80468.1 conserved hypothetical protein [Tsukamurella paurometabola DSM 20162]SUP39758.1 Uncharacterised protein [Tsukamurella paurometabola]